jgi:DNA repair protein RadD
MDFANNTARLGCINDPVIPRAKGAKGGGVAPVKECPECEAMIHASARECPHCFYEFPKGCSLELEAGSSELVRGLAPLPPVVIDDVQYSRHTKAGSPDSLKVSYRGGLTYYNEWIGIESLNKNAKAKAWAWIRRRMPWAETVPTTIDECIARGAEISKPWAIHVAKDGKYQKITGYEWGEPADENTPF